MHVGRVPDEELDASRYFGTPSSETPTGDGAYSEKEDTRGEAVENAVHAPCRMVRIMC